MALPKEHLTERAIYLRSEFEKYSIEELHNLTSEDFKMLGMYIETYNFIDFNVQRLYLLLKENGVIITDKKVKEHNVHMLSKLKEVVDKFCDPSEIDVALAIMQEIEFRKPYRNIYAHWAAKRIPNEDAIVFLSSEPSEYRKKFKCEIPLGGSIFAIMDVVDMKWLVNHLQDFERWIAIKISEAFKEMHENKNITPSN